jgi:hypothetical protein
MGRLPRCAPIVTLALMLAAAAPGCGSSESSPSDNPSVAGSAQTSTNPSPSPGDTSSSTDPDVGNPRALRRLVRTYTGMQRAFQRGNMAAVCANVSQGFLHQFPPGVRREDIPCAARLELYAKRLGPDARPAKLEVVRVRIYDYLYIGGIMVTTPAGDRIRIPFIREDGRWMLELGTFPNPETLNATLDSTDWRTRQFRR